MFSVASLFSGDNNGTKNTDSRKLPVTVPNDAVLPRFSAVHCRHSRQNGIIWHRYWKLFGIEVLIIIVDGVPVSVILSVTLSVILRQVSCGWH